MPGPANGNGDERRRRNPLRTRAKILDAATAEFSTRGKAGASVNAIADAAGVNKRMIYHYFASKDGLYRAALEASFARLGEMLGALDLGRRAPADAVAALATGLFDHAAAHPEFLSLASVEATTTARGARPSPAPRGLLAPTLAEFAAALERGVAAGVFRPVDPLQLFVTIATAATGHVAHRHTPAVLHLLGAAPMSPAALAARRRHIVDFVLAALRP